MGDKIPEIKFRKEKVAPEGGWGLVCGIGFTLPLACALASLHSFGLMFNEFLAEQGATTSEVTLITGVFFSAMSFAALAASLLFKKFSLRCVGLLGGTIYSAGSFMTIFVTSVQMLLVSYGLLQGLGTGIIASVGYTNFNHYFVKKRVFMMSASQALRGLIVMVHPILVNFTMNRYGFRGAMAIIAAINSHAIFGMLAQHPVEWHYKVIEVREHELKPLMENGANETNITVLTELSTAQKLENTEAKQIRVESTKNGICTKIVEFLDLTLLKDIVYVNLAIGISSALFSDNIFSSVLPLYLKSLGFSMDEAAMCVSVGTGSEMFSRFALAGVTFFFKLKGRHIFLSGAIALLIVRFVFLFMHSFVGVLTVMVGIGLFRTWMHVSMPIAIAEYLPTERFAPGYGLFMFIFGNWTFVFGPVTGWIRDVTQSYVAFVYSVQFFLSTTVVFWLIEMLWMRMSSKSKKMTK